jgi:uncharacterized protein with von Willebrand factor type A (vWA) domain
MRAGTSDSGPTENDQGTGPAPSVSPALSANENQKEDEKQPLMPIRLNPAEAELTGGDRLPVELMSAEEGSPELEILLIFRRKIAGLRKLTRQQRTQEIRAALEWLWSTMAALREKRLYQRHARQASRRFRRPDPR